MSATLRHRWHSCSNETCYPCSGGLGLCDRCGGAEGTLTTDCPGHAPTTRQREAVYNRKLDYRAGRWAPL